MNAALLYGKPCADDIYRKIKNSASVGTLYTIGFDTPQWAQYTRSLAKSASDCGIDVQTVTLSQDVSPSVVFQTIARVCSLGSVAGVLIEQPLPEKYRDAVSYVLPHVDVDCVNPLSVAALYKGTSGFRPATPSAVIRLLDYYKIPIEGKHVVIIGRGNAVGKPLAHMMLARNATVTICHTKTGDLPCVCRSADILVSACGAAGLVTPNFVTENTVVIDVGLSFSAGKTVGDVSASVYEKCLAVSPVPGGVGPVTRAVLLENTVKKVFQ